METTDQIRRKVLERNNKNLEGIFSKKDARKAFMPQWRQAQVDLAALKERRCPQFAMNIPAFLVSLSDRDAKRSAFRTQVVEAHVNLAVWHDRCGRL